MKNPVVAEMKFGLRSVGAIVARSYLNDKTIRMLLLGDLRAGPAGHATIAALPPLAGEVLIAQNLMYARFFACLLFSFLILLQAAPNTGLVLLVVNIEDGIQPLLVDHFIIGDRAAEAADLLQRPEPTLRTLV